MLIEQGLMEYLNNIGELLVGERIYYVKAPQDVETPYLIVTKISGRREHSHDGSSHLANPRFQFSIFAQIYYECKQIAEQLQIAMQGFSGKMGEVEVNGWFYDNETDNYEPDTNLYIITADYIGWHKE